jgi:hypothetical protein
MERVPQCALRHRKYESEWSRLPEQALNELLQNAGC